MHPVAYVIFRLLVRGPVVEPAADARAAGTPAMPHVAGGKLRI
jgi:hypothetical protein